MIGLLLAASPAAGQAPAVQEQQRPALKVGETERARSASEAAELLRPPGPDQHVEFEDVLQHPDDVELNYFYARSQLAAGELRGAASTLERILLLAPDLARVRLLHAVVLFRLDDLNEADREFRTVAKLPMDDRLREELEFYLEQIELRRKTTRYSASLAAGMQWDSNRNAGPESDSILFFDTPFDLVSGRKKSDFSGLFLAGLRARHDLGFDAGHALQGGVQFYGQKQFDETELDLLSFSAEGGGLYRSPIADLQPSLYGTYLNLDGESYVSSVGSGLRASRRVSKWLDVFARVRLDYELFERLRNSPTTDQRTGARVQAQAGASFTPLPMLRVDAGTGFVHKHAKERFYTYTGPTAFLSGTVLLGQGQFLLSSFSFEWDAYRGHEPIVSHRNRRDAIYTGGLSYGAPMGFLLPFLASSRFLRDTLFTLNATYLNEQSTLRNYQYDDWRLSFLWSKNFEF